MEGDREGQGGRREGETYENATCFAVCECKQERRDTWLNINPHTP